MSKEIATSELVQLLESRGIVCMEDIDILREEEEQRLLMLDIEKGVWLLVRRGLHNKGAPWHVEKAPLLPGYSPLDKEEVVEQLLRREKI
jgi:hypothetical protein